MMTNLINSKGLINQTTIRPKIWPVNYQYYNL